MDANTVPPGEKVALRHLPATLLLLSKRQHALESIELRSCLERLKNADSYQQQWVLNGLKIVLNCLCVYLSIYSFINLFLLSFIYSFIHSFIYLFIIYLLYLLYLFTYVCIYVFMYLCICVFMYLCICVFTYLRIHVFMYLCIYVFMYLCI